MNIFQKLGNVLGEMFYGVSGICSENPHFDKSGFDKLPHSTSHNNGVPPVDVENQDGKRPPRNPAESEYFGR